MATEVSKYLEKGSGFGELPIPQTSLCILELGHLGRQFSLG